MRFLIFALLSVSLHASPLVRLKTALSPRSQILIKAHDSNGATVGYFRVQNGDYVSFTLFEHKAFLYLQKAVEQARRETTRYMLSTDPKSHSPEEFEIFKEASRSAVRFTGVVGKDLTLGRLYKLTQLSQGPDYVPYSGRGAIRPQPVPTPQILDLKVIRFGSRGVEEQIWPPCERALN